MSIMNIRKKKHFSSFVTITVFIIVAASFYYLRIVPVSYPFAQEKESCTILPFMDSEAERPDFVDVRGGVLCYFKIYPDKPNFKFHLIGDKKSDGFKNVDVYSPTGKLLQTLNAGTEPPLGEDFFLTADFNKDGHKDIMLLNWWGATGNRGYLIWIYNPTQAKFIFNKDLSGLSNPEIHSDGTISDHSNSSAISYVNRTYKLETNNKLLLIKSDETMADETGDNYVIHVVKELQNGSMEIVKSERVKI